MPLARQRVSPVIYVAGSARELPVEVQDWLGRAETRALASPHIYDLLAQLARGKSFAAIVVNIGSVDWSEMEFFDHVAQLTPNTAMYVAGTHQQRAKLEAACRRGALLFDAFSLNEHVAAAGGRKPLASGALTRRATLRIADLLAQAAAKQAESDESVEISAATNDTHSGSLVAARLEPEPTPAPISTHVVEGPVDVPVEQAPEEAAIDHELESRLTAELDDQPTPVADDAEAPQAVMPQPEPQPAQDATGEAEAVQPINLSFDESTDYRLRLAPAGEEEAVPVIFPWSTNANRPRRVPPKPAEERAAADSTPPPPPPAVPSDSPLKSVRLTAEEIAALMAERPRRDSSSEAQS